MNQYPNKNFTEGLQTRLGELKNARVGVLGFGVSGRAVSEYLINRGATVIVYDRVVPVELPERYGNLFFVEDISTLLERRLEWVFISPGMDPRDSEIQILNTKLPILGELELAKSLMPESIAITGTNGKSTVTSLTHFFLESMGLRSFIGGNFGTPMVELYKEADCPDVAVIELSSYQLETLVTYRPKVSVVLNLTPDHSERYVSFESYAAAKERLLSQQIESDCAILNWDDETTRKMAMNTKAQVFWLSQNHPPDSQGWTGLGMNGTLMVGRGKLDFLTGSEFEHPSLVGGHHYFNAMASLVAAGLITGRLEEHADFLIESYKSFKGLPHRMEWVAEKDSVVYINDSKATNDAASAAALRCMGRSVILLAGGRSKDGGYDELLAAGRSMVRGVICFGEAKNEIAEAFGRTYGDQVVIECCHGLHDALLAGTKIARQGEAILFSPACSSFDEFKNYQERGNWFKKWVGDIS
ncbi:MAG: UDP-N-acetylmuramoyl-L-alanine--D-glutamate ligase [Myxococcota bacterium]|nr:UDP-N-acetylmuramoyl-L-alanine--D-glutamate ligase [Myxococcota bacterium]